ncbi:MAG TPA: SdrD B-like domain-containing protein [Candidatus Brocadiia bacterium]|nr:SdrD B-like domain-containing protein [Candidatus Brocadiia bacterium]
MLRKKKLSSARRLFGTLPGSLTGQSVEALERRVLLSTISGYTFNDLNGNGVKDDGEPGLAGWTCDVWDQEGGLEPLQVTTTDENGYYMFGELPAPVEGYPLLVAQSPQSGWSFTTPEYYNVTLYPEGITNLNFGVQEETTEVGSISGLKFNDEDADGFQDEGEDGLGGWTIQLTDYYGEVIASVVTAEDGTYTFNEVEMGYYKVQEVIKAGWEQTWPESGYHSVTVDPYYGTVVTGIDFGNHELAPAVITGQKYSDLDRDGVQDPEEPGISAWLINVYNSRHELIAEIQTRTEDLNGDSAIDPATEEGIYSIEVMPGTYYLEEVSAEGWIQTSPAGGRHIVSVTSGQTLADVDFGNSPIDRGFISGQKFNDRDGDGAHDPGEEGLNGWTIELRDWSGKLLATTTTAEQDLNGDSSIDPINERGLYRFENLLPAAYRVIELFDGSWTPTLPAGGELIDPPFESNPPSGNVTPQMIQLALQSSITSTQTVTLTLPDTGGAFTDIDVFLLFDDTGSFSGTAPTLIAEFPNIISRLETALPDVSLGFGVGRFEDWGGTLGSAVSDEDNVGRPFILNQPIITTDTPGFDEAINAALNREAPGYGGDSPETTIDGLYQLATGVGIDGDGNGSKLDSGLAGQAATQTTPGNSGDVPPFASFLADPANNVLEPAGNIGGAGFRPGALPIVLVATDVGTVYRNDGTDPITGIGGVTVPLAKFTDYARDTTPDANGDSVMDGASIQETINALNAMGALVIGLGDGVLPERDPRQMLESLSILTGAVNGSTDTIPSGIDLDPIAPGDPFFFLITPGSGTTVADGIVAAVSSAVTSISFDIDVVPSQYGVLMENLTGVVTDVGEGETASFDVLFTGDGHGYVYDLQFVRAGTSVVMGSIPVRISGEVAAPGAHHVVIAEGEDITGLDFGNQLTGATGSASGFKFLDLNSNSGPDEGEPGMAGIRIYNDANDNGVFDDGELSVLTAEDDPLTDVDETGTWSLSDLLPGHYILREVLPAGYFTPNSSQGFTITEAGEDYTNLYFANRELATISGVKFNDHDGDGIYDEGDEGLAGWTIQLYDTEELIATTTTDDSGSYSFINLLPGTYFVDEVLQEGWIQTLPSDGEPQRAEVFFFEDMVLNFGNMREPGPGSIAGQKFNDADGDSVRDETEVGLNGWVIQLWGVGEGEFLIDTATTRSIDLNGDETIDPITETGLYEFINLDPGDYIIREVVGSGWEQTYPETENGEYGVELEHDEDLTGLDFGNHLIAVETATISGQKFLDEDGDGRRDEGEPGLNGVTIELRNSAGALIASVVTYEEDLDGNESINPYTERGLYRFVDVVPGTYNITEILPDGWEATYPVTGGTGALVEPTEPSNPASGNVSPTMIDLDLHNAESAIRDVMLTLPHTGGVVTDVDVFLLFDDTGSFASTAPTLVAEFPTVISRLQTSLPDVTFGFGVGRFEDWGGTLGSAVSGEDTDGRPFTLNQPIITTSTSGFDAAINAALNRTAPGYGGDGPETMIDGLYQLATGVGIDGDGNGSKLDSGPAGLASTQTSPGVSGDVPAFASFTADPANNVLAPSGNVGGGGFRPGALPIVLVATDIGTVYRDDGATTITGAGGVTVPVSSFTSSSRTTTPDANGDSRMDGASIQETIDQLVGMGALVIGLGNSTSPTYAPRQPLEALSILTGAVNGSTRTIESNISGDPIEPGDPFFFYITAGSGTTVADGIVAAVESAVTSTSFDISLRASEDGVLMENLTGVVTDVGEGETASFDVEFTGDGTPRVYDLQFVRAGTSVVLGSIPVRITGEDGTVGSYTIDVEGGENITGLDFGNTEIPEEEMAYLGSVTTRSWRSTVHFYDTDVSSPEASDITFGWIKDPEVASHWRDYDVLVLGGWCKEPVTLAILDQEVDASGLGIVVEGWLDSVIDLRVAPGSEVPDVSFITWDHNAKTISLKSGISGAAIGGMTLGSHTFIEGGDGADIALQGKALNAFFAPFGTVGGNSVVDGNMTLFQASAMATDSSLFVGGNLANLKVGTLEGDVWFEALGRLDAAVFTDASEPVNGISAAQIGAVYSLSGDLSMDVFSSGNITFLGAMGGGFQGRVQAGGDLMRFTAAGNVRSSVFDVGGTIYSMGAADMISTAVNAANINVVSISGNMLQSSLAAGPNLGSNAVFGDSGDAPGSGKIQQVRIGGNFQGSDISAGVFSSNARLGDSDGSDVLSSGSGTIGWVYVGGNVDGYGATRGVLAETGSFLFYTGSWSTVDRDNPIQIGTVRVAVLS